MSELSSKDLSAVARRWIEDYRRTPSIKQGWRLVRILERALADRAEVERATAEKAWGEGVRDESWSREYGEIPDNPYRRNGGGKDGRE